MSNTVNCNGLTQSLTTTYPANFPWLLNTWKWPGCPRFTSAARIRVPFIPIGFSKNCHQAIPADFDTHRSIDENRVSILAAAHVRGPTFFSGIFLGCIMAVKPIPDGYHSATPYLVVRGAAKALEFYKKAFRATEHVRMDGPGGSVMHAEIKIGDSMIMLGDEHPEMGAKSPEAYGGSPVSVLLYVPDVDAMTRQALAAGAKEERPVTDQFWGDRMGSIVDPFGRKWSIATHKEDVSEAETARRFEEMKKQMGGK